jgi:hypothetical protein
MQRPTPKLCLSSHHHLVGHTIQRFKTKREKYINVSQNFLHSKNKQVVKKVGGKE